MIYYWIIKINSFHHFNLLNKSICNKIYFETKLKIYFETKLKIYFETKLKIYFIKPNAKNKILS